MTKFSPNITEESNLRIAVVDGKVAAVWYYTTMGDLKEIPATHVTIVPHLPTRVKGWEV